MKIFLKFIAIAISVYSCKAQNQVNGKIVDLTWKNMAIVNMSKKYSEYANSRLKDTSNNYAADIYYKIADLNRYPFEDGLHLLDREIKKKNIKFDSIICVSRQVMGLSSDNLLGNNFFIFVNNSLVFEFYHDIDQSLVEPTSHSLARSEEIYKILLNSKDADEMSLIIFTKIKPDWSFEINKIIINN